MHFLLFLFVTQNTFLPDSRAIVCLEFNCSNYCNYSLFLFIPEVMILEFYPTMGEEIRILNRKER